MLFVAVIVFIDEKNCASSRRQNQLYIHRVCWASVSVLYKHRRVRHAVVRSYRRVTAVWPVRQRAVAAMYRHAAFLSAATSNRSGLYSLAGESSDMNGNKDDFLHIAVVWMTSIYLKNLATFFPTTSVAVLTSRWAVCVCVCVCVCVWWLCVVCLSVCVSGQ